MGTLIYANIFVAIGAALLCFAGGLLTGAFFLNRFYQRRYQANLTQLSLQRHQVAGEIVGDLKHQLGNYLNIIKHRLVVMRGELDQLPPDRQTLWRQHLAHSLDHIGYYEWRMTQLIENLDVVTRLENPDTILAFSEVKPDAIVDDVVRDLSDRAAARRVELSWWARPELFPRITANHDALRQVLINIIDNGIKYATPTGDHAPQGEVDIALSANDDNSITICITDNGPGIPPDDLPRLFDKGYTTESARGRRPKEGGMGLGLYIVKTVVEKHQGRVSVESQLGQGTNFTLVLPIRRL